MVSTSALLHEIESLRTERDKLDGRIRELEARLKEAADGGSPPPPPPSPPVQNHISDPENGLSREMIYRYSRHLLLPSFGVQGQCNLSKSSILVVGAGGLGSPVAMYLAACGVGRIGIVDNDKVELNNLHRQIIHSESYVGQAKVKSAAAACRAINSSIELVEHKEALLPVNALDIVCKYDIVVDATDNLPSRYMISDCCVLLDKPLVSGAALGLEGQLTIFNYIGGPCYRCLFPTPPPAVACQRCSDSGVLGVVPGIIGCLQALEAIKIASSVGDVLSGRMLLLDALSTVIKIVKIRGRSPNCMACGENSMFTEKIFRNYDYEEFTKSPMSDKFSFMLSILPLTSRISSRMYKDVVDTSEPHVLVDVRPAHHFKIAAIPKSLNIPLSDLRSNLPFIDSAMNEVEKSSGKRSPSIYVLCRRGNDSQRAVQFLMDNGFPNAKDIIGGLESWAQVVDPNFPTY